MVKAILVALGAIVFAVVIGVAGWQFEWWLKEKNVDRQVQIDNRNVGTQTAWRDEAHELIIKAELLPEGPQREALQREACDKISRLTGPYRDEILVSFETLECL